jgi:hypothetical protein
MQSKSELYNRIPDVVVIPADRKIPPREVTNQRKSSSRRRYRSSRRLSSSSSLRRQNSKQAEPEDSISRSFSQAAEDGKEQPRVVKKPEGGTFNDSILPLTSEDDGDTPERRPQRVARRSSLDLGILRGEADSRPRRRKSMEYSSCPTALAWSFNHNDESSLSDDQDYGAGEIVLVGATAVSRWDAIDAMLNQSANLKMLQTTPSEKETSSADAIDEPLISLADLCGILIPPKIVQDDKTSNMGRRQSM